MTQIPAFAGINIPDFISKWSVSGHAISHATIHAPRLLRHDHVGVHGFGFHDPDAAAGHEIPAVALNHHLNQFASGATSATAGKSDTWSDA